MKYIRAAIVGLVLSAVIIAGVHIVRAQTSPQITTFEQCEAAGNPVQLSQPPHCSTPDGQSFTKQ